MGKSTPSAPPAPDPSRVSREQTASNVNTAVANSYLNNVNQRTPDGSLTYRQIGSTNVGGFDVPQWESTMALSPEQQRLRDAGMRVSQGTVDLAGNYVDRIRDATKTPFSYAGLPAAPVYNEQYRGQQLQRIEGRNAPAMERDRAALQQRLANQGISQGTEAWRTGMDDYQRGVNDFRLGADIQAGNAAAQQFGLEGQARDRATTEYAAQRSAPINEVAALLGTGPGVQSPQFMQNTNYQVAPTDVSGNYQSAYQGQLAQQQMQNQSNNAMTGGLFGLGGSLITGGAMFL